MEEEQQKELLREKLKLWLEQYKTLEELNVLSAMKDLVSLRTTDEIWYEEVWNLREVQKRISWAAQCTRSANGAQNRKDIVPVLRQILHPSDKIQNKCSPNIGEIKRCLSNARSFLLLRLAIQWRFFLLFLCLY